MYFWLKFFHIAAVAVWFTGLFFLPRVFARGTGETAALGRRVYVAVMTPAAAVAVALGMALIVGYGYVGAWLPAKLVLVGVVVMLHAYLGWVVHREESGLQVHAPVTFRVIGWVPLALFLAIAALTAAKPVALDFSQTDVHTPRSGAGT